mmetsp:Transcript_155215/g.274154  ORF Transcript_155215/g.274154 Transcript_155215/m.274154 type:complete len:85 (-) Transcript_155215:6-260(-)
MWRSRPAAREARRRCRSSGAAAGTTSAGVQSCGPCSSIEERGAYLRATAGGRAVQALSRGESAEAHAGEAQACAFKRGQAPRPM